MKPWLSLCGAALGLSLSLPSPAMAADYCVAYCAQERETIVSECGERSGKTCADDGDAFYAQCKTECPRTLTLPDMGTLERLAKAEAAELWGAVDLIDTQTYRRGDGEVDSHLFVFSTDPTLTRAGVLDALRSGVDATYYDDRIRGLHMSGRLDQVPYVSNWTGVSFEYVALPRGEALIRATYPGKGEPVLVGRAGTPLFPFFIFEVDGQQVWFNPRRAKLGPAPGWAMDPDLYASDAYKIHVERVKHRWMDAIDALNAQSAPTQPTK